MHAMQQMELCMQSCMHMCNKHTLPVYVLTACCLCAVYVVFGSTGGVGSALSKRLSKQEGAAVVLVRRAKTLGHSLFMFF